MEIDLKQYQGKHVHFIGIGGCSMSGLAQILKNNGYIVTGSDTKESAYTQMLKKAGIPCTLGHFKENVYDADAVVYSAAIKPVNPEYAYAVANNIPLIERSRLLGELSSHYARVACISGCHGKTTITSMLALIMQEADLDCTVHVGGMVDFLGGGVKIGNSDIFITEACEYVKSFLTLTPKYILVNNIDDDHLDCYRDIDEIIATFAQFVAKLPEDGVFLLNESDTLARKLLDHKPCRTVTYGLPTSDWHLENIRFDERGFGSADIIAKSGESQHITLNIPGKYNLLNALGAAAYAHEVFNVPLKTCADALSHYALAGRRFELIGEKDGVKIYHDYAHHPSEIQACLEAASRVAHKKLWVVFQCNSYTRARTLKEKYGVSFSRADEVLVPDLYPGRDIDTGDIHATDLVDEINKHTGNAKYLATFAQINEYLRKNWQPGDIVLTVGSGDVNKQQMIFLQD